MRIARRNWLQVATVAAAFAFVVLAVMLGLHAQPRGENPFDVEEWRTLKAELRGGPLDGDQAERLRDLDLKLRREFFRRRELVRVGGVLLLVGLAVALTALKLANRRTMPEPDAPASFPSVSARDRQRMQTRRAVSVTALLLAAGAVHLIVALPAGLGLPAEEPGGGTSVASPPTVAERALQWPSFRGHDGSGIAPFSDVPRVWDGETGTNVAWKTAIPLPGANSPVVWGDRVFLTGADEQRSEVYCVDARSGALLWRRAVVAVGTRAEDPDPMEDTGHAAPTCVTDGRTVFALFANGYVAAFDCADGEQVWFRSFGPFENAYGHASSLALSGSHVLLQLDHGLVDDGLARLVALDTTTGKTVWETPRRVDASWASPIVCHPPSGPQVVLSATPIVAAYDPATGAELWRADVLYGEVGPTPTYRDGVLYVAQEDVGLFAVRTDGTGDVTKTHVLWNVEDGAPNVSSPLCDGERVYMLATPGYLACIRASSGELLWEHELEGEYYASPSLAGNTLYVTNMAGVTTTIAVADAYEETGTSPVGEEVVASMAFAPGRIYLRGREHLFAIGGAR